MRQKQKQIPQVLKELDQTDRHRLVRLNTDGTTTVGEWAPVTELATLDKMYAATAHSNVAPGVYTLREVDNRLIV